MVIATRRRLFAAVLIAVLLLLVCRYAALFSSVRSAADHAALQRHMQRAEKQAREFDDVYARLISDHQQHCFRLRAGSSAGSSASNGNAAPVSACPCHRAVQDTRLALIVAEIYDAVDALFDCSAGRSGRNDELRPFSCAGVNWPSADSGENAASEPSRSAGLYLTAIDSLSTLILADAAASRFLAKRHDCAFFAEQVEQRGRFGAAEATAASKRHGAALHVLGLSSTTIRALDVVLSGAFRRAVEEDRRFLSVFEMNIRLVGGLLAAGDLLAFLLERSQSRIAAIDAGTLDVQLRDVLAALREAAHFVGRVVLVAFERRPDEDGEPSLSDLLGDAYATAESRRKKGLDRYGLPQPSVCPAVAAAAVNKDIDGAPQREQRPAGATYAPPRELRALSELGSFDLEFVTLSRRTGDARFGDIAAALEDLLFMRDREKGDTKLRETSVSVHKTRGLGFSGFVNAGPRGDSFFEYRVKSLSLQLQDSDRRLDAATTMLTSMINTMTVFLAPSRSASGGAVLVELDGSKSPVPTMHHLACAMPAAFALFPVIADGVLQKLESNVEGFACSSLMPAAQAVARTCANMSLLTNEGLAGEVYDLQPASSGDGDADSSVGVFSSLLLGGRELWPRRASPSEVQSGRASPDHNKFALRLRRENSVFDGIKQNSPLRPEALEALYTVSLASSASSHAAMICAGQQQERRRRNSGFIFDATEASWRIFTSMRRVCRTTTATGKQRGGFSNLDSVTPIDARQTGPWWKRRGAAFSDVQSSFFVAETLKYAMLITALEFEPPVASGPNDWMPHFDTAAAAREYFGRSASWRCFSRNAEDAAAHDAGRRRTSQEMPAGHQLFESVACGNGVEWVLNTEAHPLRVS